MAAFWLRRDSFGQTTTTTMVEVHELLGLRDITNNIEPANRLFFCHLKGSDDFRKVFAISGNSGPKILAGQVFVVLGVLNHYVHMPS